MKMPYLSNGIFSFSINYFDNIHKKKTIKKLGEHFVKILCDLKLYLEQTSVDNGN